jgi:hypothetical protein
MPVSKGKSDKQQSRRFIEAAREAECEDEAVFDENLRRLAEAKPTKAPAKPEK